MTATVQLDRAAMVWSKPEGERAGLPLVVLMHGYWGHESDWPVDGVPDDTVAVSLRAPTAVGERWAWVDFNQGEGLRELNAAADAVLAWLDELDAPQVGLVGWSQGGAMAVHLIRRRPDRFAAAAVFGGFVWVRRPHAGVQRAAPPILYAMGERDDVIPPRWVDASDRWLAEHTRLERRTYPGVDHILTAETARDAVDFVVRHLRGKP